jgi:16S rRNA processing protein RimM
MSPRREQAFSIDPNGLLEIGMVTRPHGILGEVRVLVPPEYAAPLTRVKRVYLSRGDGAPEPRALRGGRVHQNVLLLKLEGVETRNDAEALRGARVSVDVGELPEPQSGAYYQHQLLGLKVITADGVELGALDEVLTTGANDVYVVKTGGRELLLPAIESVIREIDLDAGLMRVIVPAGLS